MTRRTAVVLFAVLFVAFMGSCASTPPEPLDEALLGAWTPTDGSGMVYEFKDDGTMFIGSSAQKQVYYFTAAGGKGQYWGKAVMGFTGKVDFTYRIKGDRLTMVIKGPASMADMVMELVKQK